jgi:hypothetical protein
LLIIKFAFQISWCVLFGAFSLQISVAVIISLAAVWKYVQWGCLAAVPWLVSLSAMYDHWVGCCKLLWVSCVIWGSGVTCDSVLCKIPFVLDMDKFTLDYLYESYVKWNYWNYDLKELTVVCSLQLCDPMSFVTCIFS